MYNSYVSQEFGEHIPRSIEISFGDVFEHTFYGTTRTFVITDVGEDNWFHSCAVFTLKDGKKGLFGGGTGGPEDIHNKTGERWSLQEVIEAYNNYARQNWGKDCPPEIVASLTERSQKSPRVIC